MKTQTTVGHALVRWRRRAAAAAALAHNGGGRPWRLAGDGAGGPLSAVRGARRGARPVLLCVLHQLCSICSHKSIKLLLLLLSVGTGCCRRHWHRTASHISLCSGRCSGLRSGRHGALAGGRCCGGTVGADMDRVRAAARGRRRARGAACGGVLCRAHAAEYAAPPTGRLRARAGFWHNVMTMALVTKRRKKRKKKKKKKRWW